MNHPVDSPFTTLSSKTVYSNPWITVHEDTIIHPGGREGVYGYLESKDSVMIIATNNNDEIFLVKAFRYPTKEWGWELPGGSTDGEEPIIAAQRELIEETGFTSTQWQNVGHPLVCNGLMTERTHYLIAHDVTDGIATEEEEEFADKQFFSKDEINTMVVNGEIDDGQSLTGLYLYMTNERSI